MKRLFKKACRSLGFDVVRYRGEEAEFFSRLSDLSEIEKDVLRKSRAFTLTKPDRLASLINAVTYVVKNKIPGDIAECGVWRGGSMMTVALTLLALNDRSRSLYLYDTFEGMSAPSEHDKTVDGTTAQQLMVDEMDQQKLGTGVWCYAGIEDVRANLLSTAYPHDKIHFIKGKIEETIPGSLPPPLSLLRLDTDWYESTKHELIHLYPLLQKNGVLIIDDYGHWQGARKAVDEYFERQPGPFCLHRIDDTARSMLK